MKIFCTLVLLIAAAPVWADYWEFKDWRVFVDRVDTGEDLRITCTALTGGDGMPTLSISISNGDAGPPTAYPGPVLVERAPRGYGTQMRDGQRVLFEFDTGKMTEGFVQAWFDAEGFQEATAAASLGDNLWLLQEMRQAGMLWITLDGEVIYGASLSGFTASYLKIAEQCGFSPIGVVD